MNTDKLIGLLFLLLSALIFAAAIYGGYSFFKPGPFPISSCGSVYEPNRLEEL